MGSLPGLIPLFYEIEACEAAGYEYHTTWQELQEPQKALSVAKYYAKNFIQLHKDDMAHQEMEKARRKSKSKGKR